MSLYCPLLSPTPSDSLSVCNNVTGSSWSKATCSHPNTQQGHRFTPRHTAKPQVHFQTHSKATCSHPDTQQGHRFTPRQTTRPQVHTQTHSKATGSNPDTQEGHRFKPRHTARMNKIMFTKCQSDDCVRACMCALENVLMVEE